MLSTLNEYGLGWLFNVINYTGHEISSEFLNQELTYMQTLNLFYVFVLIIIFVFFSFILISLFILDKNVKQTSTPARILFHWFVVFLLVFRMSLLKGIPTSTPTIVILSKLILKNFRYIFLPYNVLKITNAWHHHIIRVRSRLFRDVLCQY